MKKALITGMGGQDASWLAKLLISKGYKVYGAYRRTAQPFILRLEALGIADKVDLVPLEVLEESNVVRTLKEIMPDEVYHLAAQSFVGLSFSQPLYTAEITGLGTLRMLEGIRHVCPEARFYQASSSEQFGNAPSPQDENTPFRPASPYAASKVFAHYCTVNYRESYKMFAVCGILFNHESELRGLEFVTRKVTYEAARIKLGKSKELRLGNLDACRDWGYAPEYMEAAWTMMQADKPQDFVIATGESHSVKEFVEEAFKSLDLDWTKYVVTDKQNVRPLDVNRLCGNASKAKQALGWSPKIKFRQLVDIMVKADLEAVSKGKLFALARH